MGSQRPALQLCILNRATRKRFGMSVHPWVVDLREAVDVSLCGGKAAKLAQLLRASYRVPQGFCLTMEFYRECLDGVSAKLEATARRMASPDEIDRRDGDQNETSNLLAMTRRQVESVPVPPDMGEAVSKALDRLRTARSGQMIPLVVRSSAIDEDQADAAHAGIYETFVGIRDDPSEVLAKTKACWGALWTEESVPAETILAGVVVCDRVFGRGGQDITSTGLLDRFATKPLNLQIGGKATVGRGQVQCVFTNSREEASGERQHS